MQRRRNVPAALALTTVGVTAGMALGSAGGPAVASPHHPGHAGQSRQVHHVQAAAAGGVTVGTRHSRRLGTFLVNARTGRTLYVFDKDRRNRSRCHASCASAWPPVLTRGRPHAAGDTRHGKLGRIHRGSRWQVTYAGHPLYTYIGDDRAGQTNGEGVEAFGAEWYAMRPSGAKVDR